MSERLESSFESEKRERDYGGKVTAFYDDLPCTYMRRLILLLSYISQILPMSRHFVLHSHHHPIGQDRQEKVTTSSPYGSPAPDWIILFLPLPGLLFSFPPVYHTRR